MAESRYQNRVEILQGTLDQLILQPLFAVSSTVTASPKLSAPARANCFQLRPSARKERLARFGARRNDPHSSLVGRAPSDFWPQGAADTLRFRVTRFHVQNYFCLFSVT